MWLSNTELVYMYIPYVYPIQTELVYIPYGNPIQNYSLFHVGMQFRISLRSMWECSSELVYVPCGNSIRN